MNSPTKKVTITMKSVSAACGSSPDVIELITDGTLSEITMNDEKGWAISYEDSEATGFAGAITTVSCFGERLASMKRTGAAESHLIIENGRRHHCHYGTEYGEMLMGISTSRIINRMTADGGELYFKYSIDINSALVSENEVYLEVKVKN